MSTKANETQPEDPQQPSGPVQGPAGVDHATGLPLGEAVVDELHPVLNWIVDHRLRLAVAVGVLLAAVGGYGLYGHIQKSAKAEAAAELGGILTAKLGEERVTALEGFLAQAPAAMRPAVRMELAQSALAVGDYARAAEEFAALAAMPDAGPALAVAAGLGQARALSLSGDHAQALARLTALRDTAPEAFQVIVLRDLAAAAELAGDIEGAIAHYEALKASGQVQNMAFFQYKIDRLRQGQEG